MLLCYREGLEREAVDVVEVVHEVRREPRSQVPRQDYIHIMLYYSI